MSDESNSRLSEEEKKVGHSDHDQQQIKLSRSLAGKRHPVKFVRSAFVQNRDRHELTTVSKTTVCWTPVSRRRVTSDSSPESQSPK